jgi:hypothetical protein
MKAFPRYLLLVADREGDMAREVEGLKREGVLTNETTYLWDTSFEEANFSDEELVAMIATIGADSGATLTLDAQTLRARYNQHCDTAATRREHWRHSRSGLPARMSTGTSLLPRRSWPTAWPT